MKSVTRAIVLAVAFSAPAAAFAQSNGPVTRAQVRAELVQLEKAGWTPAAGRDPHYPADLLAAEARVTKENGNQSSYGGAVSGSSAAGRVTAPALSDDSNALFDHH
ncbi:DUF4148 domain-containing protein [Caballeronia sp. LjRoot34]|uniref:DUF4148 domain-containing protein n=1 Tax=Caballeronia sp. LjRoot34 TaxID=3342325 RepID=UPI003ECD2ADE